MTTKTPNITETNPLQYLWRVAATDVVKAIRIASNWADDYEKSSVKGPIGRRRVHAAWQFVSDAEDHPLQVCIYCRWVILPEEESHPYCETGIKERHDPQLIEATRGRSISDLTEDEQSEARWLFPGDWD